MHNSDQERQDQRTNSGMEDSTAMTVEFLRKRLLSERSVSRSARQRAEELAKRVEELEEQLKIVSLQRKKAEKATADVLAILENNGTSDISEAYYSSSDQETPCESKVGNNSTKEDENSVNSEVRKNGLEELSGSDFDFSPISGRSLSWKGRNRKDTSHSLEKYKDPHMRRRSSFASNGSSPKHCQGKSCRQIRRRESRSVVEECKTDPIKVNPQENGIATSSEVFPVCSGSGPKNQNGGSEIQGQKGLLEGPHSGCLEHDRNVASNDLDFNGYGGDKDMEKALEHQAQLIGQYEAMEKAQREWEEKFRENNSSTPDSYDPGNHSDVTEERDEIKAQASYPAGTVASQAQVSKSEAEDIFFSKELSKTQPNGFPPLSNIDMGWHQNSRSNPASISPAQDFAFPMAMEKQKQESLENNHHPPSHSGHHHPHSQDSPGNHSAHVISSNVGSNFYKGESSGNQNELHALVPHKTPDELGGVLESLKQARLSLQQKVNRLPLIEGRSVRKAIEPSVPTMSTRERAEIPVGCAGLFRLPTDFSPEANRANPLGSGSQLSSTNYYPDTGVTLTAGDRFVTSPYRETRLTTTNERLLASDQFVTSPYKETRLTTSTNDRLLASDRFVTSPYRETRLTTSTNDRLLASDQFVTRPHWDTRSSTSINDRLVAGDRFLNSPYVDTRSSISTNGQLLTSQYMEAGSRISTQTPYFNRDLDIGQSSSGTYTIPTYPPYPDLSRMLPNEGFSRTLPSRAVGTPPSDHFSFNDDHIRPNMYR